MKKKGYSFQGFNTKSILRLYPYLTGVVVIDPEHIVINGFGQEEYQTFFKWHQENWLPIPKPPKPKKESVQKRRSYKPARIEPTEIQKEKPTQPKKAQATVTHQIEIRVFRKIVVSTMNELESKTLEPGTYFGMMNFGPDGGVWITLPADSPSGKEYGLTRAKWYEYEKDDPVSPTVEI